MSLKPTTKRILKSAANIRTYPSTSKTMKGMTMFGAARKNTAKILKGLSKKERRKLYVGK